MLPMLAMTAISGGLSLMSGMGARNSAKKQQRLQIIEQNRVDAANKEIVGETDKWNTAVSERLLNTPIRRGVDVDAMMADAERAGFNPETWLQSGALQAYGWETQPAEAMRMQLRTPQLLSPMTMGSVPDAMSLIGDAGQAALSTFRSEYAREDSQAFQQSMLSQQLAAYQRNGKTPGFGSVPRIGTSGGATFRGQPMLSGSEPVTPKVTIGFGDGLYWRNDTRMADAGVIEESNGGAAGEVYGFFKTGSDLMRNVTRGFGANGGMGYGVLDGMDWARSKAAGIDPRWYSLNPVDNAAWMRSFYGNPNREQPWLGSAM